MFKATKYSIGLDISDTSLKFVQLKWTGGIKLARKKHNKQLEINSYNSIRIPDGVIIDGEIKNEEEAVKNIKKLFDKPSCGKINIKEIVAVLPSTQTFIKTLRMPIVSEEEISNAVSKEIVKHFPVVLDEIYLDWQLIERDDKNLKISIGTAPKKIVDQYIKILENASLQPTVLEIEAASICRCLIPEPKNSKIESEPYLIIDLGANRSSVIVCSNKAIYFAVSAPISGHTITKKISESLKIDFKKAEKAKRICGLSKDKCKGVIREILNDMLNNLISYIEQTTSFFQNSYPKKEIKQVIICGGGANFLDIDKILFEYLKIPIIQGDPWLKIKQNNDDKYNNINKNALSYVTAMGLALRERINDNE